MEHSQNDLSLRRWQHALVMVLSILVGVPTAGHAQPAGGEALALALRGNVVIIVAERSDGVQNGFGFIVAEDGGQVWIVTANHVVRSNVPGGATRILIKFFHDQGRSYPATLLETSDRTYDLAVLQAQAPAKLRWQRTVLGPQKAERGTPVWFIGRSADWYIPTVPGRINTLSPGLKYVLDNLPVRVGTSGAPLIADSGIIGMVISDASESSEAVAIDIIAQNFGLWQLPWQLTPFQDAKGFVKPERPTPPPPPLPPTATPGSGTGTLCPTLSNGETGTLLSVSSQGKAFEVYSGYCIDLEPGTYLLTNEDRNIYCLPYHVKVKAGKTNYFKLTCR